MTDWCLTISWSGMIELFSIRKYHFVNFSEFVGLNIFLLKERKSFFGKVVNVWWHFRSVFRTACASKKGYGHFLQIPNECKKTHFCTKSMLFFFIYAEPNFFFARFFTQTKKFNRLIEFYLLSVIPQWLHSTSVQIELDQRTFIVCDRH